MKRIQQNQKNLKSLSPSTGGKRRSKVDDSDLAFGDGRQAHKVQIKFFHLTATTVNIAGSFNDWRAGATPMVALGEGRWVKELVLSPGRYEYLLIADGEWTPDPQADETVSNPFGGVNSVLHVSNGTSTPLNDQE